jgi:hypothetical protein
MAMIKHGAKEEPQVGRVAVPWPSSVLVYKAQEGVFVPQPLVTSITCMVDGCRGCIMKWPDGKMVCQKCGADFTPITNERKPL